MRLFVTLAGLILLFACYAGCRKSAGTIIFTGRIYDQQQTAPVQNAEVSLKAQLIENGVLHSNFSLLESKKTDSQGLFSFHMPYKLVAAYQISASKEGYYQNDQYIKPTEVAVNMPHPVEYKLDPMAWLLLQIHNSSAADTMRVQHNAKSPDCNSCCSNQPLWLHGDTMLLCKTIGGQQIRIYGFSKKDTTETPFDYQVYVAPFDTTLVTINY